MKKKKWIYGLVLLLLVTGIFIHTNLNRTLRWTVLLHGFPKEAFQSEIVYGTRDGKHAMYHQLEPTTVGETGPMLYWETKK